MGRIQKLIVLFMLALIYLPSKGFSELYLKPGDRGELVFTVINSSDSAGFIDAPHVVYENQPEWFNMSGLSVLSHGSLLQGTSC